MTRPCHHRDVVVVKSQKMADGRSYALKRCRDCAAWLERAQKPKDDGTRLKNKAGEPIKKRKKGAAKVEVPLVWKKMSFTDEWAGRGTVLYRGVVITRLLGANEEGFRRRAYAWLEAQQGSDAQQNAPTVVAEAGRGDGPGDASRASRSAGSPDVSPRVAALSRLRDMGFDV